LCPASAAWAGFIAANRTGHDIERLRGGTLGTQRRAVNLRLYENRTVAAER